MKKQFIDYFKSLEISENEVELYSTLLSTGPLTARTLAQIVGVKRTTAYHSIGHLIEKGIIMKVVKGSRPLLAANPPSDILPTLVQQKIQESKKIQESLPQVLIGLQHAYPVKEAVSEAEIKYYRGKHGVSKIYEEALKAKELRSYVNLSKLRGLFPENSDLFINAFKNNPDLKMFEIFEDSKQSREAIANHSQNNRFFYKFHPKEMVLSAADTLIYEGNVGIINLQGNNFSGFIIHNNDYYKNIKEFFDFVWKVLP